MRLLFIRHGDPDYAVDGLTPTGRREAEFLIETINGFPMPCGIFLDVEAPETLELPAEKLIDILIRPMQN